MQNQINNGWPQVIVLVSAVALVLIALLALGDDEPAETPIDALMGSAATQTAESVEATAEPTPEVETTAEPTPEALTVTTDSATELRAGAGADFPAAFVVPPNQALPLLGVDESGEWYFVDFRGSQVWAPSSAVTLSDDAATVPVVPAPTAEVETATPSDITVTTTTGVNLRSGPGMDFPVVLAAAAGETLPVNGVDATGEWYQVEYFEQMAWVSSTFVTLNADPDQVAVIDAPAMPTVTGEPVSSVTPEALTVTTDSATELRAGAGADFPAAFVVPPNQTLPLLGVDESGEWYFVDFRGQEVWAPADAVTLSDADAELTVIAAPTLAPSPTVTPSLTVTPSPTHTPTVTPSLTVTPSATFTPSPTFTPTHTPTVTPSLTVTPSVTFTPTATFTPTHTPTSTPDADQQATQTALAAVIAPDRTTRVVLDAGEDADFAALSTAAEIITQRLAESGIADAFISPKVDGTILVEFAADDPETVIALIARRGLLEFVDFSGLADPAFYEGETIATTARPDEEGLLTPDGDPFETVVSGDIFLSAEAFEDEFAGWAIDIRLNDDAAAVFSAYTAANIGEPLAIVLDGVLLSAPVVQTALSDAAIITGNFTREEAETLALQLRTSPLPLALTVARVETIGE